jgi:hypothetical protein
MDMIEMAVPMTSPDQVLKKRNGIFDTKPKMASSSKSAGVLRKRTRRAQQKPPPDTSVYKQTRPHDAYSWKPLLIGFQRLRFWTTPGLWAGTLFNICWEAVWYSLYVFSLRCEVPSTASPRGRYFISLSAFLWEAVNEKKKTELQ